MSKSKRPTEADDTEPKPLADAIENLAQEVSVLRLAVDELRSSIRWGLQNDKFRSPEPLVTHPPEVPIDEIVEGVAEQLAGVVEEAIKAETADFRDAVDQFSIDVQFAVRKIGEHVAAAERYRQDCLFSDDR